jgi:uncharacterized membrane protein YsdA (DUF1294 family)/cold shock CspA family protein
MKLQGNVLNWDDNKGFGFVEPNGRGELAFVHIKAFKPRSRRPVNGDVIIYELVSQNTKRCKAENIKFAGGIKSLNKSRQVSCRSHLGLAFMSAFWIGLLASAFSEKLPIVVIVLYVVMSLITFIVYVIDKSAAQNGRWRTKESTLHTLALIGGWPGAFIAQKRLRHKSSKKEFKSVYWVTVLLNSGGLFWFYTENGTNFLNRVVALLLNG